MGNMPTAVNKHMLKLTTAVKELNTKNAVGR